MQLQTETVAYNHYVDQPHEKRFCMVLWQQTKPSGRGMWTLNLAMCFWSPCGKRLWWQDTVSVYLPHRDHTHKRDPHADTLGGFSHVVLCFFTARQDSDWRLMGAVLLSHPSGSKSRTHGVKPQQGQFSRRCASTLKHSRHAIMPNLDLQKDTCSTNLDRCGFILSSSVAFKWIPLLLFEIYETELIELLIHMHTQIASISPVPGHKYPQNCRSKICSWLLHQVKATPYVDAEGMACVWGRMWANLRYFLAQTDILWAALFGQLLVGTWKRKASWVNVYLSLAISLLHHLLYTRAEGQMLVLFWFKSLYLDCW